MRTLLLSALVAVCALAVPVLFAGTAEAHPMPHTNVLLDVHDHDVTATLELPVADLGLAMGVDLQADPAGEVVQRREEILDYLHAHFEPTTMDGQSWSVRFNDPTVTAAEQTSTGTYQEVVVTAVLEPPAGGTTRQFQLGYDAVVHQVLTHTVLVSVRQDWASGSVGEDVTSEVGVVRIDTATGAVKPVAIDLSSGSSWRGFEAMVELGVSHIREGTDHLLFLLTLLLPAPLIAASRRWGGFAGVRTSLRAIAGITLAFTIGHSTTLVLASVGRWMLPTGAIEALIAVSILVSAAHAIRPIFPGKEVVVAGFFGLIHGAAFSFTLSELDLSTPQLVLSLLGFNLGIEIMQIAIVALVLPSLIVLASTRMYTPIRVVGAAAAGIAALGWFADRVGSPNIIAMQADRLGAFGPWLIGVLAVAAITSMIAPQRVLRTPNSDESTMKVVV